LSVVGLIEIVERLSAILKLADDVWQEISEAVKNEKELKRKKELIAAIDRRDLDSIRHFLFNDR